MTIVSLILNFLMFAVFVVALLWMMFGFWGALVWILIVHSKHQKVTNKMWLALLGWAPLLVISLGLWIVVNLLATLLGQKIT